MSTTTKARRRRPHPARRARKLAGAVSIASLFALTGCMAATTGRPVAAAVARSRDLDFRPTRHQQRRTEHETEHGMSKATKNFLTGARPKIMNLIEPREI